MAFSGGGSNVLKPHTHDSTILQDGGNLDFQNITQSNMSAGSMTQSDGVHLQELAIGTPNQLIRTNAGATAAEWHSPVAVDPGAQKLLATYTGSGSNQTLTISPAIDLATEFSEVIVICNLFTFAAAVHLGLYPNGSGGTFTNPYGFSVDISPAITARTLALTNWHSICDVTLATANSSIHSETHIALAKTATTTDTVYMKSHAVSNQNLSENWENTVDLGTTTLSSIQVQATGSWAAGSNISIYGVKYV